MYLYVFDDLRARLYEEHPIHDFERGFDLSLDLQNDCKLFLVDIGTRQIERIWRGIKGGQKERRMSVE